MFLLFNLRFFASSHFDHDEILHHALHVLDAPEDLKVTMHEIIYIYTRLIEKTISEKCKNANTSYDR